MESSDVYVLQPCPGCGAFNRVDPARWQLACCGRCGRHLAMTHRDVLGLPANASAEEARRAFRTRAKAWHPDLRPGDPLAPARFRALLEAYHQTLREAPPPAELATDSRNADEPAAGGGRGPAEPVHPDPAHAANAALPQSWRVVLHLAGLAAAVAVFAASASVRALLFRSLLQVVSGCYGLFSVLQIALALWDWMHPARMGTGKG